jgi:hypothetical protein
MTLIKMEWLFSRGLILSNGAIAFRVSSSIIYRLFCLGSIKRPLGRSKHITKDYQRIYKVFHKSGSVFERLYIRYALGYFHCGRIEAYPISIMLDLSKSKFSQVFAYFLLAQSKKNCTIELFCFMLFQ